MVSKRFDSPTGSKEVLRIWYLIVRDELLKCGRIQSKADLSLFYDDKLAGLFLMHVDDFLWGGNSAFRDTVINKIISTFPNWKRRIWNI